MLEYFCRSAPLGALLKHNRVPFNFRQTIKQLNKAPCPTKIRKTFYYPVLPLQILQNKRTDTSEGAIKCANWIALRWRCPKSMESWYDFFPGFLLRLPSYIRRPNIMAVTCEIFEM